MHQKGRSATQTRMEGTGEMHACLEGETWKHWHPQNRERPSVMSARRWRSCSKCSRLRIEATAAGVAQRAPPGLVAHLGSPESCPTGTAGCLCIWGLNIASCHWIRSKFRRLRRCSRKRAMMHGSVMLVFAFFMFWHEFCGATNRCHSCGAHQNRLFEKRALNV